MFKAVKLVPIALWIAAGAACTSSPATTTPATVAAAESTPAPAHAVPNPSAPQENEVVASGPIIVEDQVDVAAQRDGLISKVLGEPGTQVKKGQLLETIDERQVAA